MTKTLMRPVGGPTGPRQPRWLLSSLLIAGVALFAIGVATERQATDHHTESTTRTAQSDHPGSSDATEHTEEAGGEGTTHAAGTESGELGHTDSPNETVFGVNVESTTLVTGAAIVSLALAALTWRWNLRLLLLAAAAFAAVFAALDVGELVHQVRESRAVLVTLVAVIALTHIGAALAAGERATAAPA